MSRAALEVFSHAVFVVVVLLVATAAVAQVDVHGYVKPDGTYVAPHHRSSPDGNFYNNWSTKGNVNPYTGAPGTRVTPPQVRPRSPAPSSGGIKIGHEPVEEIAKTIDRIGRENAYLRERKRNDELEQENYRRNREQQLDAERQRQQLLNEQQVLLEQNQARAAAAQRLSRKGINVDWQQYSLDVLLDAESRISVAERLSRKGVDVDWTQYSLDVLIDGESRISAAERLSRMGVDVDWRQYSLEQLVAEENRLLSLNR